MYDIVIIGAGVSGASCARELARYELRILVLEKEADVCCGTSKANSAIVHSGIDCRPGSLMARLNLRGNERMEELARELDFAFVRNGSLILCFSEEDRSALEALYEQGLTNGVPGLRIVEKDELHRMEPEVSVEAVAAIWCPTGGIVCPFGMNIAMAEHAYQNGVSFQFGSAVESIRREGEDYCLSVKRKDAVLWEAGQHGSCYHGTPLPDSPDYLIKNDLDGFNNQDNLHDREYSDNPDYQDRLDNLGSDGHNNNKGNNVNYDEEIRAHCVINAAGVHADVFHNMVCDKPIHITPRKGEYYLLDKGAGSLVHSTVFSLPTKMGKGILVTPAVHGNLLVGPTAMDIDDKEGVNTMASGLEEVAKKGVRSVPSLPLHQVITSFAGLRAHEDGHDFIIAESAPGFFDCAGIESPGLTIPFPKSAAVHLQLVSSTEIVRSAVPVFFIIN